MTRIVVVLTAWMLTLALLVAPSAMADHKPSHQAPKNVTHRHFLKMYKVEKYLSIQEDTLGVLHDPVDTHVFCDQNNPNSFTDNDLATDGMWKIVDVDQDEFGSRPYEDVKVYASYRDHVPTPQYPGGDPSKWHFEFENRTEGQVQIKMYVTCLGWKTEPNSHRHQWTWSGVHAFNTAGNFGVTTRHDFTSPNNECPSGSIAVSPGFQFDRNLGVGDIYRSRYFTNAYRGWTWGFWVEPGPFDLDLTFHCLDVKTLFGGNPNHLHELIYDFDPGFFPIAPTNVAPDPDGNGPDRLVETRVRNCDSHEKGMVHSFDLDPGNADTFHWLWFMGMDPRIKSRAYKLLNRDTVVQNAELGLMCFNDRTGRPKKS
jgi:hypothetical protein